MAAVTERLGANRLVTITGSGGCGKTRLAVEVGVQLVDDFADGVWFIDLSPVSDGSEVPDTIATVLRIKPDRPHAVDVGCAHTVSPGA